MDCVPDEVGNSEVSEEVLDIGLGLWSCSPTV